MVEAEFDRERHGWTVNHSGTTSLFEINIEDMVRSPIPSAPATSVRAAHRPRHRQLLRRGEGGDHAVTGMAEQNSSCASRAARIASASASRRRVEPSISVNKGHDPRLHNPRGHPQRMSHQPLSQAANRDRLSRLSYHFARAHLRALANARVSHHIDACSSSNNHDPCG